MEQAALALPVGSPYRFLKAKGAPPLGTKPLAQGSRIGRRRHGGRWWAKQPCFARLRRDAVSMEIWALKRGDHGVEFGNRHAACDGDASLTREIPAEYIYYLIPKLILNLCLFEE